jgi:hypothetical protein
VQQTFRLTIFGHHTLRQIFVGGHWTFTVLQQPGLYVQQPVQQSYSQVPGSQTHFSTTGPGMHSLTVFQMPQHSSTYRVSVIGLQTV